MEVNEKWRRNQKKRKNCTKNTQKRSGSVRSTQWRLLCDVRRKLCEMPGTTINFAFISSRFCAVLNLEAALWLAPPLAAGLLRPLNVHCPKPMGHVTQSIYRHSPLSDARACRRLCVLRTFSLHLEWPKICFCLQLQLLFIRRKAPSLSLYSILFQLNGNDADEGEKNPLNFLLRVFFFGVLLFDSDVNDRLVCGDPHMSSQNNPLEMNCCALLWI